MMYVDFNLFRIVNLKCLEVFNKKWKSISKKLSLKTFSSKDTKFFKNAKQIARNLFIWLNIFKSIWRKESFNKHLMICINWFFKRICFIDLRWLNDKIVYLKKRCLFSVDISTMMIHFKSIYWWCSLLLNEY
jgi:hypothetical protein